MNPKREKQIDSKCGGESALPQQLSRKQTSNKTARCLDGMFLWLNQFAPETMHPRKCYFSFYSFSLSGSHFSCWQLQHNNSIQAVTLCACCRLRLFFLLFSVANGFMAILGYSHSYYYCHIYWHLCLLAETLPFLSKLAVFIIIIFRFLFRFSSLNQGHFEGTLQHRCHQRWLANSWCTGFLCPIFQQSRFASICNLPWNCTR